MIQLFSIQDSHLDRGRVQNLRDTLAERLDEVDRLRRLLAGLKNDSSDEVRNHIICQCIAFVVVIINTFRDFIFVLIEITCEKEFQFIIDIQITSLLNEIDVLRRALTGHNNQIRGLVPLGLVSCFESVGVWWSGIL